MKQIRQRESNKDLISINIRNIGILQQVRSIYDGDKIGELSLSIKNNIIRSPITVYPADDDSKAKAISYMSSLSYFTGFEHHDITHIVKIGHTRYLAHVKLTLSGEQGFETIEAFEDFRGDDRQLVTSQLAENLIRGELSAQDIRVAINRLSFGGLGVSDIAQRIFKDKGYVSQNLSALNVVNNVVNYVNNSDEYAYSQMGEFINKTIFAMSTTSLYTIREVQPFEIVKFIRQEIESHGNLTDFNITLSDVKSFLKNRAEDKSMTPSDTNQSQGPQSDEKKLSSGASDANSSGENQPQNQEFQGNSPDTNPSQSDKSDDKKLSSGASDANSSGENQPQNQEFQGNSPDTNPSQSDKSDDKKLSSTTSDANPSDENSLQNTELQGNLSEENLSGNMQSQLPAGVKLQKIVCPACDMEISIYVDVDGIVRVVNYDE